MPAMEFLGRMRDNIQSQFSKQSLGGGSQEIDELTKGMAETEEMVVALRDNLLGFLRGVDCKSSV